MDDERGVEIVERLAALEEEELAVRTLQPGWRREVSSRGFLFGLTLVGVVALVFALIGSVFEGDVGGTVLALLATLICFFFATLLVIVSFHERPRVARDGAVRGVVMTVSVPVRRYWDLLGDDGDDQAACLVESEGGLWIGVDTRLFRRDAVVLSAAAPSERVEFDLYFGLRLASYNAAVLIAMRFIGEEVVPQSIDNLAIPSSSFWMTDFRLRETVRKDQSKAKNRLEWGLTAEQLLFDLVHSPMREAVKPQLESRIRDEISLIDPPRV
ncbi:MAG: hypothetical protein AAFS11_04315 [Planctomycetota bacterium]